MWYRKAQEIKPRILYHGTSNPDVNLDNLAVRDPGYSGSLGEGIYFSEFPEVANFYGQHLIEAPVRIENPLTIDAFEGENYRIDPAIEEQYNNTGAYDSVLAGERMIPFDVLIDGEWAEIRSRHDLASLAHWAKSSGHDAIIARGIREGWHNNEVLLLDPDKIVRNLSK